MQAKNVAASLKKFDFQHVYISPFYRTIQTARFAAEGLGIDPSKWTISCLVAEVSDRFGKHVLELVSPKAS